MNKDEKPVINKEVFFELLDVLLKHMETYFESVDFDIIYSEVQKEIEVSESILLIMLDKLVYDKKVDLVDKKYKIRMDGVIFNAIGGYTGEEKLKNAENTRLGNLEKSLKGNRRWILFLTILISVGTLIAAWYYGIEIYKYYHPDFCY